MPHLTFFDAFYFIVVTISTVGYGDVAPTTWMSKMVVALMIAVTIVIIPIEVQQLQQVQYTYRISSTLLRTLETYSLDIL